MCFFQTNTKCWQIFWPLLWEILPPRLFRNGPIWSHCLEPKLLSTVQYQLLYLVTSLYLIISVRIGYLNFILSNKMVRLSIFMNRNWPCCALAMARIQEKASAIVKLCKNLFHLKRSSFFNVCIIVGDCGWPHWRWLVALHPSWQSDHWLPAIWILPHVSRDVEPGTLQPFCPVPAGPFCRGIGVNLSTK